MIDFTTLEGARGAFRQLYNQVQSIFNWDIKGSRLQNVAPGTSDKDAVNVKQLNDAIDSVRQSNSPNAGISQTISNLKIGTSLTPTLDNTVDIGTTSLRFKKIWAYLIDVTSTIIFTGLSTNLPLKLNGSKEVISAGIDLSSSTEVLNTLPENRGGTGTTTVGINGALTLSPTTGAQSKTNGAQSFTLTALQYKDWAGVNQTINVITALTLEATPVISVTLETSPLTAVSLTTNNFTKGKRTT